MTSVVLVRVRNLISARIINWRRVLKYTQVEIKIPFSATGMIIGRGGENISAMQSVSNCKIEVDRGAADKGMFKENWVIPE